jgi:secreted Zn-dependent insulinase-like peptidase
MSSDEGVKMWREDIGQFYDDHFSEEEMEILYEIVRGNVDVDTLKEKLVDFFEDSDIPSLPFFDLKTDEGILDRLDYDFGYVGGTGKRAGYRTH